MGPRLSQRQGARSDRLKTRRGANEKEPLFTTKSSGEKIDVSFCVYWVHCCSVHFVRFGVALLADKHSNPEGEGPSYNNVIIAWKISETWNWEKSD